MELASTAAARKTEAHADFTQVMDFSGSSGFKRVTVWESEPLRARQGPWCDPDGRLSQWFDTSVFTQPPAFTFGNVSRTLPDVRDHGQNKMDFGLVKNNRFLKDGRMNLQFRSVLHGLDIRKPGVRRGDQPGQLATQNSVCAEVAVLTDRFKILLLLAALSYAPPIEAQRSDYIGAEACRARQSATGHAGALRRASDHPLAYPGAGGFALTLRHDALRVSTLHEGMGQPLPIRSARATISACFGCHSTGQDVPRAGGAGLRRLPHAACCCWSEDEFQESLDRNLHKRRRAEAFELKPPSWGRPYHASSPSPAFS